MAANSDIIPPSEKRRFVSAVRKALRELDYQQLHSLVYWEGADENAREQFEINMKHLLAQLSGRAGLKVTLDDDPPGRPLSGYRGRTLKSVLAVHIEAQNLGLMEIAGIKDGRLYLTWPRRMHPPVRLDAEEKERIQRWLHQEFDLPPEAPNGSG